MLEEVRRLEQSPVATAAAKLDSASQGALLLGVDESGALLEAVKRGPLPPSVLRNLNAVLQAVASGGVQVVLHAHALLSRSLRVCV